MTNLMWTLAQNSSSGGGGAGSAVGGLLILVIQLAIFVLIVAGFWKVFTKAGQSGWAAIIPIYNIFILCKIVGRPWWWVILCFIPLINLIALAVLSMDVAKSFGKGVLFAVGLFFLGPIFYCILGFGSAQYQGPSAA
jgi:hypothetical protein